MEISFVYHRSLFGVLLCTNIQTPLSQRDREDIWKPHHSWWEQLWMQPPPLYGPQWPYSSLGIFSLASLQSPSPLGMIGRLKRLPPPTTGGNV